jgi:CPA1 family monovalent cation:H+ antiporter
MLAERIGLSGVLTTVCYAATLARTAPERTPAVTRIPTNAVWGTVIFALNILAFIFIGLQIGPILDSLEAADRARYFAVAGAVLFTVIVVRIAWQMSFNAVIRWWHRSFGFHPPRPMLRPTVGSGLIISWAGMRGIVTLAAAMALSPSFPYRDLIVLTSFCVVLGTLTIQGLTLKPLLRALDLHDDDPVGQELTSARESALRAAIASVAGNDSPTAELVRQQFNARFSSRGALLHPRAAVRSSHDEIHREALHAARQAVLAMRASDEIGDDAFHRVEQELDWLEVAGGRDEG